MTHYDAETKMLMWKIFSSDNDVMIYAVKNLLPKSYKNSRVWIAKYKW